MAAIGEFLRIRRNCHNIEEFEKHSKNRISDYTRRGYPMGQFLAAQDKARILDRGSLISGDNSQKRRNSNMNKDRISLFLTYNPANPDLKNIID